MSVVPGPVVDSAALTVGAVLFLAGAMKIAVGPGRFRESAIGTVFSSDTLAILGWISLAMFEISVALALFLFRGAAIPLALASTFFAAAFFYLLWALRRRPERPCGCLGLSTGGSVSHADLGRAGFLASLAVLALVGRGTWPSAGASWVTWPLSAAGIFGVVALSPDLRQACHPRRLLWSRYDCATAPLPLDLALRLLHASEVWTAFGSSVRAPQYADHWRAGCWRFFTYEAEWNARPATAVFAVRVARWQRAVSGAIVDDATEAVVLERASGRRLRPSPQAAVATPSLGL